MGQDLAVLHKPADDALHLLFELALALAERITHTLDRSAGVLEDEVPVDVLDGLVEEPTLVQV